MPIAFALDRSSGSGELESNIKPINPDAYVLLLAVAVAFGTYLYFQRPEELTNTQTWLGLASFALCLLPLFVFLRGEGSGPLPFMPAIGIFYGFAFALPVFIDFSGIIDRASSFSAPSTPALWTLVFGLAAFWGAFYFGRVLIHPRLHLSVGIRESSRSLDVILWCFILADLSDSFLHWTRFVFSVKALIEAGATVSYGYLLWDIFNGKLSKTQRYLLVGAVLPLNFIVRLTSGSLAQPVDLLTLILFMYWLAKKKLPWITIALICIIVLALHDVKGEYRRQAWFDGELAEASTLKKFQTFIELAFRPSETQGGREKETGPLVNSITARAAQLDFLSRVVDMTPEEVPYWGGETYKQLIYKLIPRALWPGKPEETLGIELSRRYGMRSADDESTSYNVPWIVEMFANFGGLGVFFGMAIVGLMFAWMDREFNAERMLPLDRVIGVVMLQDLILQENNFSLLMGNKVLVYFSLNFIFQALARNQSTNKPTAAYLQLESRNYPPNPLPDVS